MHIWILDAVDVWHIAIPRDVRIPPGSVVVTRCGLERKVIESTTDVVKVARSKRATCAGCDPSAPEAA